MAESQLANEDTSEVVKCFHLCLYSNGSGSHVKIITTILNTFLELLQHRIVVKHNLEAFADSIQHVGRKCAGP